VFSFAIDETHLRSDRGLPVKSKQPGSEHNMVTIRTTSMISAPPEKANPPNNASDAVSATPIPPGLIGKLFDRITIGPARKRASSGTRRPMQLAALPRDNMTSALLAREIKNAAANKPGRAW
jgi:hypothetical protein